MSESDRMPVSRLSGVGPARAKALAGAGIETLGDLVAWLPRRYVTLPPPRAIAEAHVGELVTVEGEIRSARFSRGRRRRGGHLKVELADDSGRIEAAFYNQGYLQRSLRVGTRLRVSGPVREGPPPALTPVHYLAGEKADRAESGETVMVDYAPVPGIKPGVLSRLVRDAVAEVAGSLVDPLPAARVEELSLLPLGEALREVHAPTSRARCSAAEERLLFNGFLATALRVEASKPAAGPAGDDDAVALELDPGLLGRVRSGFPFALTAGQRCAVDEIVADLASGTPMRRLVQGDVGCGKTAVAACAVLAVAAAGRQAAVLTPTDALARQFHAELARWGRALDVDVGLLVGGLSAKEKRDVRARVSGGRLDVAVGTHALIESGVTFERLALVVVDEQQRFGVMQRLKLVRKAAPPHLLAMTATPIPRSLSLVLWADLAHTTIRERPPGRRPVATTWHDVARDGRFDWTALADRVRQGGRTFVVFPAVDSDDVGIPSLLREGRTLARRHFRRIPVAALHGRMSEEEKRKNLEDFRTGLVHVLFTTTVIEVGVDVPDATEIVIVGASRFGLAQLHQLRGRVGRGGRAGRCHLLTRGSGRSGDARLDVLTRCDDGFEIAEHDLALRGPGDVMGLAQHGLAPVTRGSDEEALLQRAFVEARALAGGARDVEGLVVDLMRWSREARRAREYVDAG